MSAVLVTAGMGMLGHRIVKTLSAHYPVAAAMRNPAADLPYANRNITVIRCGDLTRDGAVERLLDTARCDVVVNTVGLIKQRREASDTVAAIAVNALLPHTLAAVCGQRGIRLIHFSTDCVFSGARASVRGPDGYRESDLADARDLYGLSKQLGEPSGAGCLTIRTSLVGRELRGHHGLVSWFLRQPDRSVRGYKNAIFTGLSTGVASDLVHGLIARHAGLSGVWHVAAEAISKYDFLELLRNRLALPVEIHADEAFYCDRRLDGSGFRAVTGWRAPSWADMIEGIAADPDSDAGGLQRE